MSTEKEMSEKLLKASQEKLKEVASTAMKMMNGVTTVADVRGIGRAELEAAYSVGSGFYRTGRYEDAEKIFYFLCIMEHTCPKYWTALGAVRQVRKEFKEAITAYAAAAMFDLHLPKPHFYAAECALAMGDFDSAESGCRTLLAFCPAGVGSNDEFRAKAEKLLGVVEAARKSVAEKK